MCTIFLGTKILHLSFLDLLRSWAVSRSLSFLIFEFHDSPRFVKTGIISLTLIQSGHKMGTSIIYLHKIRCSALI